MLSMIKPRFREDRVVSNADFITTIIW